MKIYLANKIFLKLSQLEKSQRDFIISKYKFNYSEFCAFQKKYVNKTLNLFELVIWNEDKWCGLPPNLPFFLEVAKELGLVVSVVDKRVAPNLDTFPKVKLHPRENQLPWLEKLKGFDYNALMTLPTGSGKSALTLYIASLLKTPTLFVASKTSYLESYKKEVFTFIDNPSDNFQTLDSNFFKSDNPEIKAFNVVSIQTLSRNLEHLEKFKESFGFVILDEIHSALFANEFRKAVFSLNSKYIVYLSATPKIKSLEIVNCMISTNIISDDNGIDFDINYQPIIIDLGKEVSSSINKLDNFGNKKSELFSIKRLQTAISNLAKFAVDNNRGVMIYSTNKNFQESISAKLNEEGINNIIFNSDTKKANYEEYLTEFDKGSIKVIIGGVAVVEALSLYRLSLIIDCDISLSDNGIAQLIGRLKRKNDKICTKSKVYVKIIYKDISERKFNHNVKPILNTMSYVKLLQPKQTNDYNFVKLFES